MSQLMIEVFIIIIPHLIRVRCIDPCTTKKQLDNFYSRSYIYEADTANGEELLCDRNAIKRDGEWFYVNGNQFMVTNATKPFGCGTQFGIWMNGTIPSVSDGEVSREVCVPGKISTCDEIIEIRVKKCSTGVVYLLKPTKDCPQAYCFGYGDEGAPPSVKINKPTVTYKKVKRIGYLAWQELEYICRFNPVSDTLYYQVHWYIDGKTRHISPPKDKNNVNETNLKTAPQQLTRMGVMISCAVRARLKKNSMPGTMSPKSPEFFAGIKVLTPTVMLNEGENVNVTIKSTVPFGCIYRRNVPIDCTLNIEMYIPYDIKDTCKTEVSRTTNVDNLRYCGTRILSSQWNQRHNMTVSWRTYGRYTPERGGSADRTYLIGLKILNDMNHPEWDDYIIESIKVQLSKSKQEAVLKGKICRAFSAGIWVTFDGWQYNSQEEGVYTLYRHRDHSYINEVQTMVTICSGGSSKCICGVSVRAGPDVFVIDKCPNTTRSGVGFRSCRYNLLNVTKVNELNYEVQIYLPSGTYVHINLWTLMVTYFGYMKIDIYPSAKDIFQTEGLCGMLDNNVKNEYLSRDNHRFPQNVNGSDYPLQFTRSWRVNDVNNLFTMADDNIRHLTGWQRNVHYCTCPDDTMSNYPSNTANCSPKTSASCMRDNTSAVTQICFSKIRLPRAARPGI